jgi:alpha-D-ribose 1-methylphosphonate 5-triphosphate synthase subunit PhnG
MRKTEWKKHWIEVKDVGHDSRECPICKARAKTIRANMRTKAIRSVYADLGMVRVKGNLGGTYYE